MFWTDRGAAVCAARRQICAALAITGLLAACVNTPVGSHLDEGRFGQPTEQNRLLQTGALTYSEQLGQRFAAEVPTTITFAFNSASLDETARAALRQQARFIRHFPEVRFAVYGHTDAVGSADYNYQLGLRRAHAAVNFIVSQGVSRDRLQALVSLGESQPVVATDSEERRNRRTVTQVSGFVADHPMVLDGQYARITQRSYFAASD